MATPFGFKMTPARREAIDRIARSTTPIVVKPLGPGPWFPSDLSERKGRGRVAGWARFRALWAADWLAHKVGVPYRIQRPLCFAVERAAGVPEDVLAGER